MEEPVALVVMLVIGVGLSLLELLSDGTAWRLFWDCLPGSVPRGWRRTPGGQVVLEWADKCAAIFVWWAASSQLRGDGSSALLVALSWVVLVGGCCLALAGQRWLLRWRRRRRIARMFRTGGELGFPATLRPWRDSGDELWVRVAPGRLTVAADRSLPDVFRHPVTATFVEGSRRPASATDAPGRLRWASITLVSNGDEQTLSAAGEFLDAVIACLPQPRKATTGRSPTGG